MVVGSLPRPEWVKDVIADRSRGRISEKDADWFLDSAILSGIRMQERAGLDYISDGEWRRGNYVGVFAERTAGFRKDDNPQPGRRLQSTHVAARLKPERTIFADDAAFLRHNTDRKIIMAIPSPFTLGVHLWHPERSVNAYPHQEEFVEECACIIREEIIALIEIGVDAIQLDEPWQPWLTDPATYNFHSEEDIRAGVELSIHTVNSLVEGLGDAFISVHLCHSHNVEGSPEEDKFLPLMEAVKRMEVDRFAMEFNSAASGGFSKLKDFPGNRILGLGVINTTNKEVETPGEVIARVEAAMEFVPKERIVLNPDCGFATSASNPKDLDVAYRKLSVMCRAAETLRGK
jgi:5-methyltetrahydropteroyltriglutamate--homocysteine methyltransferase